jgi:hypothetical protein
MTPTAEGCLVCERTADEIPLIPFRYRGTDRFICPQHLPTLIHDPGRLADVLPGAEGMSPADHDD